MPRKFNHIRAAAVLVEAALKPDREVASAYGVSVRTVEYWRNRLKTDTALQQEYQKMAQEKFKQWVGEIPASLEMAILFIRNAAHSGDITDPKMVEAMTGTISVLSEVLIVQQTIAQREKDHDNDD